MTNLPVIVQRKRPDVLIVMHHLDRGGAQRVVTTLANAWVRRGIRVSVLTFEAIGRDFFALDDRVERLVHPFPVMELSLPHPKGVRLALAWMIGLRRAIRQTGAPTVLSFLTATNVQVVIACLGLRGLRLSISERNDPTRQPLQSKWKHLRRWFYRFADGVTANSPGALEAMKPYVSEHKLTFVANPPATPSDAPYVLLSDRQPTILAVGRLTHQKAYDVFLAALGHIEGELGNWQVVIVGDGPLGAELESQSERLGLGGRVTWAGRQTDPFVFYRSADIFVLPSRYEGMPNALMEAMGEGLPAVVTDSLSGALEFVEHGHNGLVVPAEDAGALGRAIVRLTRDADLRARLGTAARERLSRHSLDDVLKQWEQVLQLPPVGSSGEQASRSSCVAPSVRAKSGPRERPVASRER